MNILFGCEESQRCCIEFRKKGHNAFSCDIIEESGGHPEWHIQNDVFDILNAPVAFFTNDNKTHYIEKWDMVVLFPPCTHLAVSGAAWFAEKRKDGRQREGIEFFLKCLSVECEKLVVENPVNIIMGNYVNMYFPELAEKYGTPIKPSQIIHPWMFGDGVSKKTCLWIKGLPNLVSLVNEEPPMEWFEWVDKNGKKKRQAKWFADAWRLSPEERAKVRSKTFPGIAKAMADQWG